jgi:anti-sigma factor RsiW
MNCSIIKEKYADYLTGDLDEETKREVQAHITDCTPCREELESLSAVWTKLGVLPEEQPGPALRERFYAMLETQIRDIDKEKSRPQSAWKPAFSFAFSALFLIVGLAGGYLLTSSRQGGKELARLHQEVQNMRQTVATSLLSQTSPSARLEGVSWSAQVSDPNEKTLEALFDALNSDPNVNVRLAAVDALYLFRSRPLVKDNLIRTLSRQNSPIVQVALIDLLVEIRESRAADALKQLLQSAKLNPAVKSRAELGLKQLI